MTFANRSTTNHQALHGRIASTKWETVTTDCSRVKSCFRMQTARESHIPGAAPPLTAGSSGSVVSLDASQSEIWDDFCRRNDDAWFWHTTKWLDYTLDYRPELSPRSHSFLFLVNGKPAAICPLVLETSVDTGHAVRQFSFGGDAVPAPVFADELSEKLRKSVKKSVYAHIDELARKHQVHRIAFRSAPLAPSFWTKTSPQPNPFLREGFSDISLLTQIVDLSQDEPQLFRELRNDHQRDILRVEKSLEITIFDQSTITAEQFERYRSLHRKAAGRTTRPASTFAMMHQWIRDGLAILSCATLQGQDVGFTL